MVIQRMLFNINKRCDNNYADTLHIIHFYAWRLPKQHGWREESAWSGARTRLADLNYPNQLSTETQTALTHVHEL